MIRLDKTKIYIIAVVATLILAGIGYAFLSSDLSLNGTISVKKHEEEPEPPICKRATTLHTETCNNNEGCADPAEEGFGPDEEYQYSPGEYNIGDTITYGSLGTPGTLASGDAFDCDVNGDGIYNATNERFYYITELDTNNSYGVLIYYNNVDDVCYDSDLNAIQHGPITAKTKLPTTSQWKNVSLSNTTRNRKWM